MKISICITTLNEEQTIGFLLNSLLSQTKRPDEIIIVDGGSADKTADIIRHYQKKSDVIKLIVEKGSIAHGRNTGVELARGDIVVLTDAGCVARSSWLKRICEPFKYENVGMVAGFYKMTGDAPFQKAIAPFLGVVPERFSVQGFLPSARSMAFRKDVYESVGGFCEKLDRAGEDTEFNFKIQKLGIKIARVKDAIVEWEVPESFKEALLKFYIYARGDAQAKIFWNPGQGIASHNIKILSIFARYLFLLILLAGAFLSSVSFLPFILVFSAYLAWSVYKMRNIVRKWGERLWLPIIQISSDFCVMAGFIAGTIGK